MAVGAWTFYNKFRKNLGNGTINMTGMNVKMLLATSASNAATATLSIRSSITSEVAAGSGYATSGLVVAATKSWTAGASAGSMRLNFGATQWKASGGTIANIKFAVLYLSGPSATAKKLLCYSQLSTGQFSLTNQNTLTITPAATGVFNLT